MYTDPQIHSIDGKGYGVGNLGMRGIMTFLESHTCNQARNMGDRGLDRVVVWIRNVIVSHTLSMRSKFWIRCEESDILDLNPKP